MESAFVGLESCFKELETYYLLSVGQGGYFDKPFSRELIDRVKQNAEVVWDVVTKAMEMPCVLELYPGLNGAIDLEVTANGRFFGMSFAPETHTIGVWWVIGEGLGDELKVPPQSVLPLLRRHLLES